MTNTKPKSRKVAWVVLGVMVVALVVVGISSWRYLLYEELVKLTDQQPIRECLRIDFKRLRDNQLERLSLYSAVRSRPRGEPRNPHYMLADKAAGAAEWPLSGVFVLKNRFSGDVKVIALDLEGRQAKPRGGTGFSTTYIHLPAP